MGLTIRKAYDSPEAIRELFTEYTAILVAGDSNYWFESGECHDVEIAHNVFTDACLGSYYQFCDGVISISPVVPKPRTDLPYHKNIRIHDNLFDTVGVPVLYAFSCGGLEFTNNRIFKSYASTKWHQNDCRIKLRYCVDADVSGNEWIGKFDFGNEVILDGENLNIITE